jgi:hypothetical protein
VNPPSRSPDERSEIRERPIPHSATLHAGYMRCYIPLPCAMSMIRRVSR